MNTERKAEWVAALRSGKYKKARGVLSAPDKDGNMMYCCLGVACELAVEAGVIPSAKDDGNYITYGKFGSTATLPEEVQKWLEFPNANGELKAYGVRTALTELNDGVNLLGKQVPEHSFDRIADIIESRF